MTEHQWHVLDVDAGLGVASVMAHVLSCTEQKECQISKISACQHCLLERLEKTRQITDDRRCKDYKIVDVDMVEVGVSIIRRVSKQLIHSSSVNESRASPCTASTSESTSCHFCSDYSDLQHFKTRHPAREDYLDSSVQAWKTPT